MPGTPFRFFALNDISRSFLASLKPRGRLGHEQEDPRNTGAGGTTGSESGPTTGAGGTTGSDNLGEQAGEPERREEGATREANLKNSPNTSFEFTRTDVANAKDIIGYMMTYLLYYRLFFLNFTEDPPKGAGYPKLYRVSPYLYANKITCYVAKDGVVIAHYDGLEDEAPEFLPPLKLKVETDTSASDVPTNTKPTTKIIVKVYDVELEELVRRLTFGLLADKFADKDYIRSKQWVFWDPIIVRHLAITSTKGETKRSYYYLEILFHRDNAAWDQRGVKIRVPSDIRRDFAYVASRRGREYGSITYSTSTEEILFEKLNEVKRAIDGFEELLSNNPQGEEGLFHDYLKSNPILLDVYAETINSKPRFHYPEGTSPLGKAYVEPDFIIKYPGDRYKLVELEKPGKSMATEQGQPRSEVSQAAFQIAEWDTYIRNHYDQISSIFSGISVNRTSMIVISRSTETSFGAGRDVKRYMELLSQQYRADEVFTYDDLLSKAKQAYTQLSTLSTSEQVIQVK